MTTSEIRQVKRNYDEDKDMVREGALDTNQDFVLFMMLLLIITIDLFVTYYYELLFCFYMVREGAPEAAALPPAGGWSW